MIKPKHDVVPIRLYRPPWFNSNVEINENAWKGDDEI